MVGGGSPAACSAAAALALAVALWMTVGGTGEEVAEEDVEDEDEEVLVLRDAGCAAMRAEAECGLRRAPPLPPPGERRSSP